MFTGPFTDRVNTGSYSTKQKRPNKVSTVDFLGASQCTSCLGAYIISLKTRCLQQNLGPPCCAPRGPWTSLSSCQTVRGLRVTDVEMMEVKQIVLLVSVTHVIPCQLHIRAEVLKPDCPQQSSRIFKNIEMPRCHLPEILTSSVWARVYDF